MGAFGFIYFGMVDTAAPWAVFAAIVLARIPHDMPAGGANRRSLYAAPALQRRFARISASIHHRRWPGAAHRNRIVCELSLGLRDLDLYRGVRSGEPGGGGDDARLRRQGHLLGI